MSSIRLKSVPLFFVCWAGKLVRWASEGNVGWFDCRRWVSAGQPGCWVPEPHFQVHSLPSWPPEELAWEKDSRGSLHHCPWPPTTAAPSAAGHPVYWCTPRRPDRDQRLAVTKETRVQMHTLKRPYLQIYGRRIVLSSKFLQQCLQVFLRQLYHLFDVPDLQENDIH